MTQVLLVCDDADLSYSLGVASCSDWIEVPYNPYATASQLDYNDFQTLAGLELLVFLTAFGIRALIARIAPGLVR